MQNEDILAPLPMVSRIESLPSVSGNLSSDLPGKPVSVSTAPTAIPQAPKIKLDGQTKAAIVVRLLLNEGADIPLEELPEPLQAQLTQQMGRMRLVDRQTLGAVVHVSSTYCRAHLRHSLLPERRHEGRGAENCEQGTPIRV